MTSVERKSTIATRPRPEAPAPTPPVDEGVEDIAGLVTTRAGDTGHPETAVVDVEGRAADFSTSVHELYGPPPPPRAPRSTFASVAEADAALRADFGVVVKDWQWTTEELSRIHETFSSLGPVERAALQGLEVRREMAPAAGQTDAIGVTGAVFSHGDAVDGDGQRIDGAAITFFDAAFPTTGDDTIDRQLTMVVTLHEVGHALEGHAIGDGLADRRSGARLAANVAVFENALSPDHEAVLKKLDRFRGDPKLAPLRAALGDWSRAHHDVGKDSLSMPERAAAVRNLERAQSRAAAALAGLPVNHRAQQAATTLVAMNAEVTQRQPSYLDGVRQRSDAEGALGDRGVRLDDEKTVPDETLGALEQAFAEMEVRTTDYGSTAPVENFAEAFMLYKRAPATLRAMKNGAAAMAFFEKHFPP
jgi:hypothetical protein